MTTFDTWESYFYPPPDGGTLRNLLGERDPEALRAKEYGRAELRHRELITGKVQLERSYDAAHVRAIHRHLFGDVYAWAGQFRTVNISKGPGRPFGDVKTGEVDRYLSDVRQLVDATAWGQLGRAEFGEHAAHVFAYLNQAHPFREGNGRTSKVFMEHVAQLSRFTLDFARVAPFEWNQASAFSRPDLHAYEPVPDSLVPVFRHIAVERSSTSVAPAENAARARSPLSASYPRPATAAPGTGAQPHADSPRRPGQRMPGQGYTSGRGEGR